MESSEQFISRLYRAAAEGEWRRFRDAALALVCAEFGAVAAAWWSHGERREDGELSQHPRDFTSRAELALLPLPADEQPAVTALALASGSALAYAERRGGRINLLVLCFEGVRAASATPTFERIGWHLCEADLLALAQMIRRDDWLHALGRSNRGAAALVDAGGFIHAASERFYELLGSRAAVLPFVLSDSVLEGEHGEFTHDALHLRTSRYGNFYLLYARKPLPLDRLSPREQEIARALGHGKTLKTIARQHGIAISTVANHTTRIYRKLAIYRREDLIELLRAAQRTAASDLIPQAVNRL